MYKRTIGSFALATALFVVLWTSAVPTRAAGTATGSFIVDATVDLSCSVKATTNINFGSFQSPVEGNVSAQGEITVDCPTSSEFWISLSKGNGAGATFAQRKMTSFSNAADTLIYSLYLDGNPWLRVWGDGTGGSERKVGLPGLTAPQSFTVYGMIPAHQVPAAGSYQDTIVVNLIF